MRSRLSLAATFAPETQEPVFGVRIRLFHFLAFHVGGCSAVPGQYLAIYESVFLSNFTA